MNPVWRHMALSVFEKQDPEELTLEEIDQAIEKYPYFPVLHYIKAAKLRLQKDAEAHKAAARAALYFPNPQWLEYQLSHRADLTDADESLAEIMTTHPDTGYFGEIEPVSQIPEAGIVQEDLQEEYDDKRVYGTVELTEQDIIVPAVETDIEENIIIDEIVPAVEVEETEETVIDEIVPAVETNWEDDSLADEVVPAIEKEIPANEPLIPIEPLYTIDYFASQGIKLPVDEIPSDQLGKKLKSFTEWLKSMKKLQPDKVDRQMDSDTENHIRKEAEHSNDSKEVYTEALAEVYLKQGLEDKAVEVFKKLSLLDPSKSAYFAARIREIKEI